MLKQLMLTTAAAALVASAAVAQTPAPPTTPAPAVTPAPAARADSGKFVTAQTADQWLATKFKGTDVVGTNNEKIGDVSDILFEKDGKVLAYVISVGGFLGIGSKEVAIMPASFQVMPATDRDNMKLKLAMSKDELKAAADFRPMATRAAPTTGMAPPRTPAPAPATPAPSK